MDKVKILLMAPSHDAQTRLSRKTVDNVYSLLKNFNTAQTYYMPNWLTFERMVNVYLEKIKPDLLIYFGHGDDDSLIHLFGMDIITDKQAELLQDCIVYTWACHALNTLGPHLVEKGVKSFIGNNDVVYGARNQPFEWAYGNAFTSVWTNAMMNLLHGVNVRDTVSFAKAQWFKLAEFLERNRHWNCSKEYREKALLNANAHGYLGDGDAHLPYVIGW